MNKTKISENLITFIIDDPYTEYKSLMSIDDEIMSSNGIYIKGWIRNKWKKDFFVNEIFNKINIIKYNSEKMYYVIIRKYDEDPSGMIYLELANF